MAIIGQGVQAGLGRVDYTPYLQGAMAGAQGIASGISQIGQAGAKAIDLYQKNKEEEKQALGIIKAANTLTTGFEPILDKIDPKIGAALQDLRARISDPNLSTIERATAAKTFMDQAPTLMNAGVRFLENKQNLEARQAEREAKIKDQQRKETVAILGRSIALGEPVPQGISPDILNEAIVQASTMREKAQMTERVDKVVDGKSVPYQVTTNLLTGARSESRIQGNIRTPQEEAEAARLSARAKAEEEGYFKLREGIYGSVPKYTEMMDQNRIARELVKSGGTVQGTAGELKLILARGFNAVFPGTFDTTPSEILKKTYSSMALTESAKMKGQGQITNDERKRIDATVAQLGDTPEAAIFIMNMRDAIAARELAKAEYLSSSEKGGIRPTEGDLTIGFYKDNPLENFMAQPTTDGKRQPSATMERVYENLGVVAPGTSPRQSSGTQPSTDRARSFLQSRGFLQ